ncbi:hypothetical protein D7Z54_12995 [Salibacterium salarium]|uniref:Uncharacterized protein n=1 Tax=Salibacterium salarium TaxID=284579 RepID=A0A428N3M2_9BACI|nr:hypothetical protein [Salibacterium salarium]RSL32936.1 hypothetical protein D7Z54_12995 [Salibacterium salarium]
MKPFYVLGVAVLICFTIIGTAATILLYDGADDDRDNETRSKEELAGELDEALGVDDALEDESGDRSPTGDEDNQTEQEQSEDNEQGSQEVEERLENDSSSVLESPSSEESNQYAAESEAISLGPEDESISIDKLIQSLNE